MKSFIIGLTGPTGAGKSTAAEMFEKSGFFRIDADKSARAVTLPGSPLLKIMAETFGDDVIRADGALDRALVAERAFATPEATAKLNAVSFPFIVEQIGGELAVAREKHQNIMIDAPTLYESGADKLCDCTIGILSDRDLRLRRITERDGISLQAAMIRIGAGKPDSFYTERCDYILNNNGDISVFSALTAELIKKIISESEHI